MHPFLSDNRKLFRYMLAWLTASLPAAAALHWSGRAGWPQGLLFALPLCLVLGFSVLSAYYVCRALPYAQRRLARVVGLFGAASLVSAGAWLLLALAWNGIWPLLDAGQPLVRLDDDAQGVLFIAAACLYLLSLLAHDVLIAFDNARDATERAAAMRALAREAELQMLRSQVDPHFLFNSLNSICALIDLAPADARAMTIDLAEFFRRTLALSARTEITLAEEVALCEHYLAIEKRRFGAKLAVELQIEAEARPCLLPPMCLQPLIENALKHGIRHLDAGGMVSVRAAVRDGWLHLTVANPIDELAVSAGPGGVGLKNLRERLGVFYDTRARIRWWREAASFHIELTLPGLESREP
ncbi:histidine kinase [Paludibacterium purpuratum]|uniref:Histidine kinase n=2 Tax=Paludibacterium purpuratum TaxID=1144873 RepID=A0A4R7B9F0_9NEIS|nr:histidine kinase [Paludibacterium purpuratum]